MILNSAQQQHTFRLRVALALVTGALLAGCAGPGAGVTGNDTGGIVPWSPQTRLAAKAIAADHCARYAKRGRVTSVTPGYGNYIGFACSFDRRRWRSL